jgi:hypothetical protein
MAYKCAVLADKCAGTSEIKIPRLAGGLCCFLLIGSVFCANRFYHLPVFSTHSFLLTAAQDLKAF